MADESALKGVRVLIVEDEFLIADDLGRALQKAGGVPVGPVNSLDRAEQMVRDRSFDAAIVDINLRGEMASEFVARLAAARLPCVIVSGYGDEALPDCVRNVRRLEKPVSPASVMRTLSDQLAAAPAKA